GEVERVLKGVNAALVLVDADEGPIPQARGVLRRGLALGLRVIVVIYKVGSQDARPADALNETFDLFIELGANDEQADLPVVYAVGLDGRAGYAGDDIRADLGPLFETIIKEVPARSIDQDAPPRLMVTTLEYDAYKGQIGIGRLQSGTLRKGMPLVRLTPQGERTSGRLEYLFTFHNLTKVEADEVRAG